MSESNLSIGDLPQPDLTPAVTVRWPKMGDIVIYYQGDGEAAQIANLKADTVDALLEIGRHCRGTNGTRFHPAIVTRVWGTTCVNLVVFQDTTGGTVRSSATMLPDFEPDVHCVNSGWRFRED